ncbi:MAG TPA: hypothetical protein VNW04_20920 [Puia sp.]|nr:hypothetical protein [Puia sp.]
MVINIFPLVRKEMEMRTVATVVAGAVGRWRRRLGSWMAEGMAVVETRLARGGGRKGKEEQK